MVNFGGGYCPYWLRGVQVRGQSKIGGAVQSTYITVILVVDIVNVVDVGYIGRRCSGERVT